MSAVLIHRHDTSPIAGNAVTFSMAPQGERGYPLIMSLSVPELVQLRDALNEFDDPSLQVEPQLAESVEDEDPEG